MKDGSFWPVEKLISPIKLQHAKSGTQSVTYKLMKPTLFRRKDENETDIGPSFFLFFKDGPYPASFSLFLSFLFKFTIGG